MKAIAIILAVFVCILLFPLAFGIIGGIFGIVGGIIGAIFGIIGGILSAVFGVFTAPFHFDIDFFDFGFFQVAIIILIAILLTRRKPAQ